MPANKHSLGWHDSDAWLSETALSSGVTVVPNYKSWMHLKRTFHVKNVSKEMGLF